MLLPTPHGDKLRALQQNSKLPEGDRERVRKAITQYEEWVASMGQVQGKPDAVVKALVDLLSAYKQFIDLETIFDSRDDFLYRQKGQLKLDNSIIEEFLPHLTIKVFPQVGESFRLGPHSCFSAVYFASSLSHQLPGGGLRVRSKNQDFSIVRRMFLRASHDVSFSPGSYLSCETYLGYMCAECKTNLDKTMFQEASATAHDVKAAVPGAKYYLLCEWLDMTPTSTAPTDIDEVLILRKGRRLGSQTRQTFSTFEGRRQNREHYAQHLQQNPFAADVFARLVAHIGGLMCDADPLETDVLNDGYF